MSDSSERMEKDECADRAGAIARRALLRRGVKLVYVVPAVLAAMRAVPADAQMISGGPKIGVLKRDFDDVPADLLALIVAVERESLAA